MLNTPTTVDVLVIGGHRLHGWDSLRLFYPATWSSIPGWPMPASESTYPTRAEVIDYLSH